MTFKILAPGIVEFENVISNTNELILKIETLDEKINLNLDKTLLEPWKNWVYNYENKERPTLCMSKIIPAITEMNPRDIFYEDQKYITECLENAIAYSKKEYCNIYNNLEKIIKSREKFSKLLKYSQGHLMPEHADHGTTSRALSLIVYLNDNYSGGELFFRHFGITAKPSAGSVLCFPSNFIYLHEVKEITFGNRYSYPVWFHNQEKPILPKNEKNVKV